MLTRAQMDDHWDGLAGAVKDRWPTVGGEELENARGSVGRVVGLIQQRTGEDRATIEHFLDYAACPVRSRLMGPSARVSSAPLTAVATSFLIGCVAGLALERLLHLTPE